MLQYLNALKYVLLANIIGCFSGYLLSGYVDNKFFDEGKVTIKTLL